MAQPKTGFRAIPSSRPTPEGGRFRRALDNLKGRGQGIDEDKDIAGAVARLSQTADGAIFLDWIYAQTLGHPVADDASEGALRADGVRKSFATKIFNLRDRGLKRDATGS